MGIGELDKGFSDFFTPLAVEVAYAISPAITSKAKSAVCLAIFNKTNNKQLEEG